MLESLRSRLGFRRIREAVREEFLRRQRALLREVATRRIDHPRAAARVHLVAREIAEVVEHRAMNESRAAGPRVFGFRIGKYRNVGEAIGMRRLPAAGRTGWR